MASEINLKSSYVRKYFTKKLLENVKAALKKKNLQAEKIERKGGYFLLYGKGLGKIALILQKIFGVHSIAFASNFQASSLEEIAHSAAEYFQDFLGSGDSFRVKAKRSGKHSFTSIQVEAAVADELRKKISGLKLDLSSPKKTCLVEVRDKEVYLFKEDLSGLGGLPVGAEGAVAVFLDSWKDALAAFLFLKRGCNVFPLIEEENNKTTLLLNKLSEFNSFRKFIETKKENLEELIRERNIQALVKGDTELNRKKSDEFDAKYSLPVLRPLLFYPGNLLNEKKSLLGV